MSGVEEAAISMAYNLMKLDCVNYEKMRYVLTADSAGNTNLENFIHMVFTITDERRPKLLMMNF